jgi:hypothetical protein
MKVICAGAPETGTASFALALRQLGLVVHDCAKQVDLPVDPWVDILLRGQQDLRTESRSSGRSRTPR